MLSRKEIQRALTFWPQDDLAGMIHDTIIVLDNDPERTGPEVALGRRWQRTATIHAQRPFRCSRIGCDSLAVDQQPSEQPSVCADHDPGR